MNQDINVNLADIAGYQKFLKKDSDPSLKVFQSPEGFYLNVTRIEQTDEERNISESMEKIYKIYDKIVKEQKNE